VLLGFVVPLGLLEIGARVYYAVRAAPYPLNEWAYLAKRPPPYADADYFSPEFVEEARQCLRSSRKPAKGGGPGLAAFQGEHIRIAGGIRRTTDRPPHADHRILVFGGSTVLSRRVPDAMTIPSHLQRLVNDRPDLAYAVANRGSPGAGIGIQAARLRATRIDPGDIVIFYDGINDAFNTIYRQRRNAAHQGDPGDVVGDLAAAQRRFQDLGARMGEVSVAARLLFDLGFDLGADRTGRASDDSGPVLPKGIENTNEIERLQSGVADAYGRVLAKANRYVTDAGGVFHHFLQPNLYIQLERSAHEERLMQREAKLYPGFETAVQIGYPKLRSATRKARAEGVASTDLTGVLTDRSEPGEVYFDRAHVNHVANGIIAQAMFDSIFAVNTRRAAR
jgi:hypothetical protein